MVALGAWVCTLVAPTPIGRVLVNLLNWWAFIAGFIHMFAGLKGDIVRMGFGLMLVLSAISTPLGPEGGWAAMQLFMGVGGFLIKPPSDLA